VNPRAAWSQRTPRRAVALALVVGAVATSRGARAYDPATSHAGLTERAVLASVLHKVLTHRLARPLGLFEPVLWRATDMDVNQARALRARLLALDPAGGYRPGDDGAAPAVAWVIAGAVIAQTPAERGKNLFYDPSRGAGLGGAADAVSFGHAVRQFLDGGALRSLATGTDFNLTGLPATAWLVSPANDIGLVTFQEQLDAAVSSAEPARRNTALARALLALGGTLAVLQDAGEPAHVRNDYAGAFLSGGAAGGNPFDRGSAFERFVAERFGRTGVPAAGPVVRRPTLMAFITASDAQGLADRTQRRFFSAGTLPADAIVDRDTTPAQVLRDARGSLPYGLPGVPRLELRALGERRYVYETQDGRGGGSRLTATPAALTTEKAGGARRVLGYERVPGRVRFFLDEAVYADTARELLPEIGAYGAGLIDHLFRAELRLVVKDGALVADVAGARGAVRGTVRVFVEDGRGQRREVGQGQLAASGDSVSVGGVSLAGARRIAAVLRGQDEAGELVAVTEQALP
jgi:hypothetical protein